MHKLRHIGIYVNDIQMMKEFYIKNFHMRETAHDIENGDYISNLYGGGYSIQVELYKLVTDDGCMIELLKIDPKISKDVHSDAVFYSGCAHMAFTIEDAEKLYRELKDQGICFYSSPILSTDEKHKVCFCRDPEGNYLELVEEL